MNWKRYGLVLVLAVMTGLLAGAVWGEPQGEAPGVVSAKEFRLIDKDGKTRAILGLFEGKGKMTLRPGGETGSDLSPSEDGHPALCLYDSEGRHRAFLSLRKDGVVRFYLYDKTGGLQVNIFSGSGSKRERLYVPPSIKINGSDVVTHFDLQNALTKERAGRAARARSRK